MTALAGRKCDLYVTAGAAVAMPLEAMSDVSANAPGALVRSVYAVTNTVKRYFDPGSPLLFDISLNSGGSWAAVVPDHVRAGSIAFNASQQAAPAAMFRVNTGNYLPYARMGGGHEWDLNPPMDLVDVTEFPQTSKHHIAVMQSAVVTLKRWWLDDSMRSRFGSLLAVCMYVDQTAQPNAPRWESLAYLKADSLKAAVKGAIEEDLTFECQSEVAFLSA